MNDDAQKESRATWKRRSLGIFVVGGWLLTMGFLAWKEHGGERLPASTNVVDTRASSTWLGLYLPAERSSDGTAGGLGQRVGLVHMAQRPETRDGQGGMRLNLAAELSMTLLGRQTDLDLDGVMWRPLEGPGMELDVSIGSMGQELQLHGEMEAKGDGSADQEFVATVTSAGEQMPLRLPIKGEFLLQSGFGTATRFPAMEVGDDFRLSSFDPLTLSQAEARVRCVGEESLEVGGRRIETRVLEVDSAGLGSRAWIDADGEVVRAETPFGLVMQRLEPRAGRLLAASRSADGGSRGGAAEEFLALTAIRPAGPRPARGAMAMTVRLAGIQGLEIPDQPGQERLRPGVYELRRAPEPTATQPTPIQPTPIQPTPIQPTPIQPTPIQPTPATASEGSAEASSDPNPWLAADAFVQSTHPAIVEASRDIVGNATDPWQQALRIHEWVFTRLDKIPVMSIPSALEVLDSRQGDCNEHAVLYTALARAAGLPTRVAIGVVWSDELDGFYYHAWPEVWIRDRFVGLDPTLGQPLADATHLALLHGGIETWPRLLGFLGRLEMTVLDLELPTSAED